MTVEEKIHVLVAEIRQCINDDNLMAAHRKLDAIDSELGRLRTAQGELRAHLETRAKEYDALASAAYQEDHRHSRNIFAGIAIELREALAIMEAEAVRPAQRQNAAAPTLLDALKDTTDRFESCLKAHGTAPEYAALAVEDARAAIAKAEG